MYILPPEILGSNGPVAPIFTEKTFRSSASSTVTTVEYAVGKLS